MLLAPWVYDLYTPGDKRLKAFSNVPFAGTGIFPAKLYRRIGPFGSQVPQGIYLPDVELMLAECQARLNNLDAAKTTLQVFRKKRMPDSEANVNIADRDQLIKFVIEERLREFALYGYRWFDMRRLSKDPLFNTNSYKHVMYNAQTSQPLETYTLEEKRLTLRFPLNVMNANPGMQNNP
ncbi:SusD family protein [compost metagenome]